MSGLSLRYERKLCMKILLFFPLKLKIKSYTGLNFEKNLESYFKTEKSAIAKFCVYMWIKNPRSHSLLVNKMLEMFF